MPEPIAIRNHRARALFLAAALPVTLALGGCVDDGMEDLTLYVVDVLARPGSPVVPVCAQIECGNLVPDDLLRRLGM